jgi:hypothetical protein
VAYFLVHSIRHFLKKLFQRLQVMLTKASAELVYHDIQTFLDKLKAVSAAICLSAPPILLLEEVSKRTRDIIQSLKPVASRWRHDFDLLHAPESTGKPQRLILGRLEGYRPLPPLERSKLFWCGPWHQSESFGITLEI